jgi:hypothetical protein
MAFAVQIQHVTKGARATRSVLNQDSYKFFCPFADSTARAETETRVLAAVPGFSGIERQAGCQWFQQNFELVRRTL